jgi:hypothetical protein
MDIINKSVNSKISNSSKNGFFDTLSNYEGLVIFLGFLLVIIVAIVVSVLYQQFDSFRTSVVFNNINAVFLGLIFMYVAYSYMDEKIKLFGISFDMGLLLFLSMAIFIIFVLGD